MKPQCNTSADCLRELARVMDQFGIEYPIPAVNSKYVRFNGASFWTCVPTFGNPDDWQFAIAEVEGKPVFIGDELYWEDGRKIVATELWGSHSDYEKMTWNPPKPKTVMVEMTVEDAENLVLPDHLIPPAWHRRLSEACKLALEKLNETNTRTD